MAEDKPPPRLTLIHWVSWRPALWAMAISTWLFLAANIGLKFWPLSQTGFTQEQVEKTIKDAVDPVQSRLTDVQRRYDVLLQQLKDERQSRQQTAPQPTPPPALENGPRIYTNKTITELMGFYEGRTALQGDVFMADEEGKWIATEGIVREIQPEAVVILRVGNYSVNCIFDAKWKPKLSAFRNGETMKIVGMIIPGQNGGGIYLRPCELRD